MQTESKEIAPDQPITWPKWWKIIIGINVVAGLVLWLDYSTDFSWAGTMPDLIFPPVVAALALASFLLGKIAGVGFSRMQKLAFLPSLIGGGLPVVMALIMLIPPFTLGLLFAADEIANEKQIETIASPNKALVANVYFRGVGAYGSGNGRISIRVKSRWLPIVERDIYSVDPSYADESSKNYVSWKDNNTLEIHEPGGSRSEPIDRYVRVGVVRFEVPDILMMPIYLIYFLVSSVFSK